MQSAPEPRTIVAFGGLLAALLGALACGRSEADVPSAAGPGLDDGDAGSDGRDAGAVAVTQEPMSDAGLPDAAPFDGGADGGDGGTSSATGATGYVGDACDNAPATRSPSGEVVVYDDCQNGTVFRNVVTGAVNVLPQVSLDRVAQEWGLVFRDGSSAGMAVASWSGALLGRLPMDQGPQAVARVRGTSARWVTAFRGSVAKAGGGFEAFFRMADSVRLAPFDGLHADTASAYERSDVIVSEDGALVASLDTDTTKPAKLVVASSLPDATATTSSLPSTTDARWIPETVRGATALFHAGRLLYHADLTTGGVVALSAAPVIAATTAGLQRPGPELAHVECRGDLCYWIEATTPSSHTIKLWNRTTPATAPTVVTTGSGGAPEITGYPSARRFLLTGDGSRLVYLTQESAPPLLAWRTVPTAGGASSPLGYVGVLQPSLGGLRLAAGDPPDFFDLGLGVTASSAPLVPSGSSSIGLIGPDGTPWLVVKSPTGGGYALDVKRFAFTGASATAASLPASADNAGVVASSVTAARGGVTMLVPVAPQPSGLAKRSKVHVVK